MSDQNKSDNLDDEKKGQNASHDFQSRVENLQNKAESFQKFQNKNQDKEPNPGKTKSQDTTEATMMEEDNLLENASGDVKELAKALAETKAKAEENWNTYLRARADMENIRRRAQIDIENAQKYSLERFAREMLSVLDSLEHGLQVADSVKDTAYHEGMALTLKLCEDTFEKFGIQRIDPAIGTAFDPLRHEAISAQTTDDMEPNKILVVAQKGYSLHDRVLRAARVIVSRQNEK